MMKRLVSALFFFLLLSNSVFAVEKPQIYMPYPIVFVSGIGTSANKDSKGYPSKNWPNRLIFKELRKYFLVYPGDKKKEAPKYIFEESRDNGEKSHLEFFFYDSKEKPVDINANMLKDEIEKIRKYTYCGRPIGTERFLDSLQKDLGLTIKIQPRGRPRKIKK